jgi:hypothetical protein
MRSSRRDHPERHDGGGSGNEGLLGSYQAVEQGSMPLLPAENDAAFARAAAGLGASAPKLGAADGALGGRRQVRRGRRRSGSGRLDLGVGGGRRTKRRRRRGIEHVALTDARACDQSALGALSDPQRRARVSSATVVTDERAAGGEVGVEPPMVDFDHATGSRARAPSSLASGDRRT